MICASVYFRSFQSASWGVGNHVSLAFRSIHASTKYNATKRRAWSSSEDAKITEIGSTHPIHPVLPFIASDLSGAFTAEPMHVLGSPLYRPEDLGEYYLDAAVKSNVRYLLHLGYFSDTWDGRSNEHGFRRGAAQEIS